MCGIVTVVRHRGDRTTPDLAALVAALDGVEASLRSREPRPGTLDEAARALAAVDRELLVGDGIGALVADPVHRAALEHHADACFALLGAIENRLDAGALDGDEIEAVNAALVACKDAVWAIRNDRIGAARRGARSGRRRHRAGPRPSPRSTPSRSRCRPSTASRFEVATPPVCT